MPVIWGFDLSEMSWGAFSTRSMMSGRWHLRRERFIVYQLAMLICLAAECTATYSLDKYEKLQDHVEEASGHIASLHNDDIIAAQCLTIVFCVFVATLFGADFFFLLFWPRRRYPVWYNVTKKILAVVIMLGVLAAALMSNVVVAHHSAFITNIGAEQAKLLTDLYFRPPLKYSAWGTNIAWVVLLWIGWLATAASTVIMFVATDWEEHNANSDNYERKRGLADNDSGP